MQSVEVEIPFSQSFLVLLSYKDKNTSKQHGAVFVSMLKVQSFFCSSRLGVILSMNVEKCDPNIWSFKQRVS